MPAQGFYSDQLCERFHQNAIPGSIFHFWSTFINNNLQLLVVYDWVRESNLFAFMYSIQQCIMTYKHLVFIIIIIIIIIIIVIIIIIIINIIIIIIIIIIVVHCMSFFFQV